VVRVVVATLACAVCAAAVASTSSAGKVATYSTPTTLPLRTAVLDPILFLGPQAAQAFTVTRAAGATYVRLSAVWAQLAPGIPAPGFDDSNPDSPGYNWTPLDVQVEDAERAGLQPILDIGKTPGWALVTPVTGLDGGTPQLAALGAFAHALAAHYKGNDGVPAVHVFQVWNEPNLSRDLSPVDPATYRAMVNTVAAAVHQVDSRDLVVAGALDPFENHTSQWHTMAPLAFMRQMLCVSAGAHPHATCTSQAHFDVWSHHPYTFGGPFGKARLPDDVSLGDLPKMAGVLHAATRLHHVVSSDHIQFWVTEFALDTDPPRQHHTLSLALQARAVDESFHQMWLSGVSLATWFLLQDEPLTTPYQCGFYYYGPPIASAKAKPSLIAFRFPFVAYLDGGSVSVWGRDGTSTSVPVTVQLRSGVHGAWTTVAVIRANQFGIFEAAIPLSAAKSDWLRAVAPGSGASLPFSLTRPHYPHWGPWGR